MARDLQQHVHGVTTLFHDSFRWPEACNTMSLWMDCFKWTPRHLQRPPLIRTCCRHICLTVAGTFATGFRIVLWPATRRKEGCGLQQAGKKAAHMMLRQKTKANPVAHRCTQPCQVDEEDEASWPLALAPQAASPQLVQPRDHHPSQALSRPRIP